MTRIEAVAEASRLTLETGVTHYATRHGLGAWNVKERHVTPDKSADAERTTLPTDPCFKCGARGWCDHRQPEPVAPIGRRPGYSEFYDADKARAITATGQEELRKLISNPAVKIEPKLDAAATVALMRSKGWTL